VSLGVYISYPFCAQKCTYCNFASGVFPGELERDYVEGLRSEIVNYSWSVQPDTVYLGGGTPSQIDNDELASVLQAIPGRPWREASIETAPGTVTAQRCRAWIEAGVNRVSLGVQSFVPRELARTGRKHTAEVVADEIACLRSYRLSNINIDLIAGLPGQNPASWRQSLEWIARIDAPHVSIYMLEVDEDSRLGQEVLLNGKRYGAPDVPGDDMIGDMYEGAVEYLSGLGLRRYEISNFARPGFESLHNLKYWRLEPYVGFGADAHSFDGPLDGMTRSQNVETAAEYVECFHQGKSSRLASVVANQSEERFFVGLRLSEGILPEPSEWRQWETPIKRFLSDGLLETRGERLRLTDRGVMLSNEVFAEFVGAPD
jgi:oxygen-independent coproporphyrinogen III oxidase